METDSALKLFFGSFEQNEKNRHRKRLLELMRTSQSDSKKQHAHYYSLILAFFLACSSSPRLDVLMYATESNAFLIVSSFIFIPLSR